MFLPIVLPGGLALNLRVPLIIGFTLNSGKKKQYLTFIERVENSIFRVPLKANEAVILHNGDVSPANKGDKRYAVNKEDTVSR